MSDELTDLHRWILIKFQTAKSREALAFLADMLKDDKADGARYTKNADYMATVRLAYKTRLAAIDREYEEREGGVSA